MPGFVLGIHTVRMIVTPTTPTHRYYLYIAVAYGLVAFLELAFFIKAAMPTPFHQNSSVTTSAFRKAAHWWIYYYATLVVTPSQVISLIYACVSLKKTEEAEKSEVEKVEQSFTNEICDDLKEPVLLEQSASEML